MFDLDIQTTLSYAAIFGIVDDLKLHGTQYSWLSSIFYFGFLAWAFPTNFLLQRLPIGMCSIQMSEDGIVTIFVCDREVPGCQYLHVVCTANTGQFLSFPSRKALYSRILGESSS